MKQEAVKDRETGIEGGRVESWSKNRSTDRAEALKEEEL
jgi:hypothetical protein